MVYLCYRTALLSRNPGDKIGIAENNGVIQKQYANAIYTIKREHHLVPITKNQFEGLTEGDNGEPSHQTNRDKILSFLREHPDKAFTQSEIQAETGMKSGSVGPTLVRLREKGRVDHRENYWRVSDYDESLDEAANQSSATVASREQAEETPQFEEWQEHAVDPRER